MADWTFSRRGAGKCVLWAGESRTLERLSWTIGTVLLWRMGDQPPPLSSWRLGGGELSLG